MIPVGSADKPIPQKLLDQISCSCSKKGCIDNSCGCRKSGLKCSNLCVNCFDDTCSNLETTNQPTVSDDEYILNDDVIDELMNEENDEFVINLLLENAENVETNTEEMNCSKPARKRKL